jgi:hypothetical protein
VYNSIDHIFRKVNIVQIDLRGKDASFTSFQSLRKWPTIWTKDHGESTPRLLIRGRKILLQMPAAPFKLGISGPAMNWISVIIVGVTSVVSLIQIIFFTFEISADISVVLLLPSRFANI